jgi:multiple sugar transport system ATP-binding protein
MASITIKNLVKLYGDGFPAVNDVSLDIADGEFVILVGPSGCGKSTLLRMIVGLEDITSGDLLIGEERVNQKAPRQRNLSMVFQNYALYPHLTVFENIAFPLRLRKTPDAEVKQRVEEAAKTLELTEHLQRKPSNLSGGQRQRVAMGRAIVRQADAFLFDEPLSNLDAKLRGQMRTEILRMQRRMGITTVYVTHEQVASPRELYERPVNLFVAGFIGSPPMNFLPAFVRGNELELPFVNVPLSEETKNKIGDHQLLIAGIRPEKFDEIGMVEEQKKARGIAFNAEVDVTEWLGAEQYAFVPYEAHEDIAKRLAELEKELDSEQMRTQMVVTLDPASRIRDGETAELWLDPTQMHLFNPHTGENLTLKETAEEPAGRHSAPTDDGPPVKTT